MTDKGKDIAELLTTEIFTKYGVPKSIVSDRDSKFTSHVWIDVFKTLGTQLHFSSGDHPQTDGQTERVIKLWRTCSSHM